MRFFLVVLISILLTLLPLFARVTSASDKSADADRLRNRGVVLREILSVPDEISEDLLGQADCPVVYPSVFKARFFGGGIDEQGARRCRQGGDFKGSWCAPARMAVDGGSFGFQIARESRDLVLLAVNETGARGTLSSKVKLGADGAAARGPVGRASPPGAGGTLGAEHLSYSGARGLFAGVSLEGSSTRPDNRDNRRVYGRKIPARDVVLSGTVPAPRGAEELISILETRTQKRRA
jgi:lipid-binding SYLF domain-containing protein